MLSMSEMTAREAINVLTDIGKNVFDAARRDAERQTLKPRDSIGNLSKERGFDANNKLLQQMAVPGKVVSAPIPCSIHAKSR
jgi:hypothetical protein